MKKKMKTEGERNMRKVEDEVYICGSARVWGSYRVMFADIVKIHKEWD